MDPSRPDSPSQPPSTTPPPVPSEGPTRGTDGDPLIGTVLLGRVRILRHLASGGMGRVYVGEQTGLKRPCAVKVLDPRLASADAGDFARRFLLEASVSAKLTHPNAVTVFDYGETADGSCFIAMEYLDGRTLSDELKKGRMTPERAVHVAKQVCRALREAHALGVVHRDIKPGNVFLTKSDEDDDFVKVLDFGLVGEAHVPDAHDAARAGHGPIMGSPRYMSPEQVQGKGVDARTDVYAVGAVLYSMLCGHPPFERATDLATMMAQVADAPPPLASVAPKVVFPQGLEAVVMKCLAKDPDDRFTGMDELLVGLRLQQSGEGVTADSGPRALPRLAPPVLETTSGPSLAPAKKARSLAPLVVGVLSMLVVGAVLGGAELLRRRAGFGGPASQVVATPPPAASPPSTKKPMASATLHVETVPPGAKIKEEGETLCESTPCDIVYTGEAASPNVDHLLVFLKPDYKLERKVVTADISPLRVKLSRAK